MAQKLNRQQAQWSLFLLEFELKLIHIPGTQMVQSDALSQQPDLFPEEDLDNKNKTLLHNSLFISAINIELKDLITSSKQTDTLVMDTIQALRNGEPLPMKSRISDWTFEEGLIFYKGRCYVPNNLELWRKILQWYHDLIPWGTQDNYELQKLYSVMMHLTKPRDWWDESDRER